MAQDATTIAERETLTLAGQLSENTSSQLPIGSVEFALQAANFVPMLLRNATSVKIPTS
jgi:hypothetical protein